MTARPHHVGSAYDKAVVDFMAEKFRSWGYDVEVEKFDILFPTPKLRLLEMTAPAKFTASLTEPPVEGDPFRPKRKKPYQLTIAFPSMET